MAELENPIVVGSRVMITRDRRTGIVRFVGPVHFKAGLVMGIELDRPYVGTTDGSIDGWAYFRTEPNRAVFVKKAELMWIADDYVPSEVPSSHRSTIDLDTEALIADIDDIPERYIRGMGNALADELLDYKSGPDETTVVVFYELEEMPIHDIKNAPKSVWQNAIVKALPEDLKNKVSPSQLHLSFEKLDDDKTEMKVEYEAEDPEQADDLKWTMLDPLHVRRFNDEVSRDVKCNKTYLVRTGCACCKWVKPCICCICCWAIFVTAFLGMLTSTLFDLGTEIENLKSDAAARSENYINVDCSPAFEMNVCEAVKSNMDRLDGIDMGVQENAAIADDILHADSRSASERFDMKVIELIVTKNDIDETGAALTRCPGHDWDLMNCWVYLPDEWHEFETYTDPDGSGFPDCSCYCQHESNDPSKCSDKGAKCEAQCVKYGVKYRIAESDDEGAGIAKT